mgnify:CR=1 FL=1
MPHLVLRRSPAIEDQQILEEGFLVGENKGVSLKQNCLNSLSRSVLLERILPRIIWRRTLSLVQIWTKQAQSDGGMDGGVFVTY